MQTDGSGFPYNPQFYVRIPREDDLEGGAPPAPDDHLSVQGLDLQARLVQIRQRLSANRHVKGARGGLHVVKKRKDNSEWKLHKPTYKLKNHWKFTDRKNSELDQQLTDLKRKYLLKSIQYEESISELKQKNEELNKLWAENFLNKLTLELIQEGVISIKDEQAK